MAETVSSEPKKWFIVYPLKDKEEVEKRVTEVLKLKNITCVYNGQSDNSVKKIKQKMDRCQKIIVILTKHSVLDEKRAEFKAIKTSNRIKEVVFIWMNLDSEDQAKELKKKYTLYGENRMFQLTPDFDWSYIEETSTVFIGQAWVLFAGYTKIILPELEGRIKESEWYKNNPDRFPLKQFNLIPKSANTEMTLPQLDKDIKEEGELRPIVRDRGSHSNRKFQIKVYSITKNNEKYYFVGIIANPVGIFSKLEKGTNVLQTGILPKISSEERLREVNKFASLLKWLISHEKNGDCNNRARVLTYDDSGVGDLLLEEIQKALNEEKGIHSDNDGEISVDKMAAKTSFEKIEARDVYKGLAWAYVIDYLSIILDGHVSELQDVQQYEPEKIVFDKLVIVVPSSVASKPLKLLDSDSFKQDRPIIFRKIKGRDYQLILYTLRKADKEYVVAAEHPNAIICLQEMYELQNMSGLSMFSTEAHNFCKLVEELIERSTVAGQAQVLYYDDKSQTIDEAVFDVVRETKRFSFQTIKNFIQSMMNYLHPTDNTKGDNTKSDTVEYTKGDLVEIKRFGYSHWGIYDDEGCIYHLAGLQASEQKNVIRIWDENFYSCKVAREKIEDVADGSPAKKNNTRDNFYIPSEPKAIIERAKSLQSEPSLQYSPITMNCEHFATYCRYGDSWSKQVDVMFTKAIRFLAITGIVVVSAGVWKYKATPRKFRTLNYIKEIWSNVLIKQTKK